MSTRLGTVLYVLRTWLSPGITPGLCAFLVQLYQTYWTLVYASMYSRSVFVILQLLPPATNI